MIEEKIFEVLFNIVFKKDFFFFRVVKGEREKKFYE